MLRRDKPEAQDRDFFAEQERLRQLKEAQQPAAQQQAQPPAQQPSPPPALPPAPRPAQPQAQPAPQAPVQPRPAAQPQAPQITPLEALIEALKLLGMDVKPFEALREYARQLDEKEREVAARIEELQRLLEAIRRARQVLRQLGV
jgi:hypothetical protein